MSDTHSYSYLAAPYSSPDPRVRNSRVWEANRAAAWLMQRGTCVYSPITHGSAITEHNELPEGWQFWRSQCFPFVHAAKRVLILALPGWKESVGVQAEMKLADELLKPVALLVPQANGDYHFEFLPELHDITRGDTDGWVGTLEASSREQDVETQKGADA